MSTHRIPLAYLLFTGLFMGSFIIAGTGWASVKITDLGIALGLVLVLVTVYTKHRISIPPYFWLYLAFTAALGLQVLQYGNPFDSPKYFSLFLSAGLIWLASYNAGTTTGFGRLFTDFAWFIIWGGVLFAFLAALYPQFPTLAHTLSYGVVAPYSSNHHHLGIWWGIVVMSVYVLWLEKVLTRRSAAALGLMSAMLIVWARARSTILGLLVGGGYLLFHRSRKQSISLWLFAVAGLGLLLAMSIGKSWTSAWQYIRQGVYAWIMKPEGYGVGNYSQASIEAIRLHNSGAYITSYAHNVIVELLVGMGYWGLIFLLWFMSILRYLARLKKSHFLYTGIFLFLSTVMMVDVIYLLPVVMWTWGMSLGLAQTEE